VRVVTLEDPGSARVVDTTDPHVSRFDLRPPRKLSLPGHGDVTVEGFLFLPEGEAAPHATIVEMHGGPYYRYGDAWTDRYPWHVLVEAGFAVFIANPRGGTGYGEELLRGNYRGFGTDDYRDLMAAVDALVERRLADPARLGFTGYSYGGLMTNTVVTRTDRFRAAVSIAGLFNFVSAMGQNNPQLLIDAYRRPWDHDLARLWTHSPASRAASITTPTLIMHGEEDQAVDPRQSIEMFTYLQLNAVPSRLVLYPGEGHGIDRPSHMRDYQRRELDWFRHHLLDDSEAEGATPPVPVEP
jgi:dipeptidyl aminopeptidase/acylaminoacyl peptidase